MCLHQDRNCGRNCPCDCMNCLFASDRDERRYPPELTSYLRKYDCVRRLLTARYGTTELASHRAVVTVLESL